MKPAIAHARLNDCATLTGTVVVIDVIRAFTTAAYALAAGAEDIVLVADVEEALALRSRFKGSLLMGEVGGLPPRGFDLGNSPAALQKADVRGRRLIQRTSSGTQGVVRCTAAKTLLCTSFVCADATLRLLAQQQPTAVTFLATAQDSADEDLACAEYLAAHLRGEPVEAAPYLERVRSSAAAQQFLDPAQPNFAAEDIALCTRLDCFDFALAVQRRDGLLLLRQGRV